MTSRRAFTLVELLVVIGIIAVLISILLPTLQMAREHAKNVQCLSNLRSCGQALYMYAHQNKGMFPPMALQSPETLVLGGLIAGADNPTGTLRYAANVREALARIVNPRSTPVQDDPKFSPGGLTVFYCPGNFFWDGDAPGVTAGGLSHWPEDFMATRGRIKYWYYGNPNPYYPQYHFQGPFGADGSPPAGPPGGVLDWRFWDTNKNGDNRDEFIVKLGDKDMAKKLLMTDHSRQQSMGGAQFGFQFVHGPRRSPIQGWKNNLYGDGHAESRYPRKSSFSADGKLWVNPSPGADEIQPRWGNPQQYQMW
jgi:prepilin-type N-terminal cleavage/methylation domain-containing protein